MRSVRANGSNREGFVVLVGDDFRRLAWSYGYPIGSTDVDSVELERRR